MSAALLTAAVLSLVGLFASLVLGLTAHVEADVWRHATTAVFGTFMTLLTHSMMMFYLIGKTKAIREAVTEGKLSTDFVTRSIQLRKPVFARATLAMALTMVTAFLGAGVDVRAMPAIVHALVAYLTLAANLVAVGTEVRTLAGNARIVAEVNRLLGV